jgi:hypothetical protein
VPASNPREGVLRAAMETLRPMVSRLLDLGAPFGQVESRLRELFVEVAEAELAKADRKPTDSGISLLTGINRKELRRIRAKDPQLPRPASFGRSQAASLISRWMTDPRTTDRKGRPRPIPYQGKRGVSFVKLAREVTVDVAPGSILQELIRTGAVELKEGDVVSLRADSYVPSLGQPEKLAMLGEDPPELVETMLQNIFSEGEEPLLQRKVFFDNLGADGLKRVRREMRRAGERFVREINRRLAKYDRDRNPKAPGGERRYAGIGVYYFESSDSPKRPKAARRVERRPRSRE